MNKHTPGPWWNDGLEVGTAPMMSVKVATVSGKDYEEAKANARLISSAPELLEMLKKLTDECSGDALGTVKAPTWTTICQAAALIHKATRG